TAKFLGNKQERPEGEQSVKKKKQWTGKNCLPFVPFWNAAKKKEKAEKKDKNKKPSEFTLPTTFETKVESRKETAGISKGI
ncbi:hypothetical protein K0M31_005553, partial [Melipona bicolor]